MKKCPTCGEKFEPTKKHRYETKYCSPSCANKRIPTEQTKEKMRKSNKQAWHDVPPEMHQKQLLGLKKGREASEKAHLIRIIETSTENLGPDARRNKVILEQKGICDGCGLSEWMDKPITFEMDHIDGNNKNNKRENLRALCPNCHSQTATWRGRNNDNTTSVRDAVVQKYLKMI